MKYVNLIFIGIIAFLLIACDKLGGASLDGKYTGRIMDMDAGTFDFRPNGKVTVDLYDLMKIETDYKIENNDVKINAQGTTLIYTINNDGSISGPAGIKLTKNYKWSNTLEGEYVEKIKHDSLRESYTFLTKDSGIHTTYFDATYKLKNNIIITPYFGNYVILPDGTLENSSNKKIFKKKDSTLGLQGQYKYNYGNGKFTELNIFPNNRLVSTEVQVPFNYIENIDTLEVTVKYDTDIIGPIVLKLKNNGEINDGGSIFSKNINLHL